MFAALLYAVVLLHGPIVASAHNMEMHDHSAPDMAPPVFLDREMR
jgi:hypothetical protein